jgi:hypothetical protein
MPINRCIDKDNVLYIHIGYYLAIKKNKIMSFTGKQVEVEIIMLTEISQTQKDKYHMFSFHMWNLQNGNYLREKGSKGRRKRTRKVHGGDMIEIQSMQV